ncbi:AraC family transcriptional regulator [Desulfosporosinus hippei]|uniref:AraC family transcriptional regulator n=1 Tax=Desulfosporosinus hippei DSM 8344 TaxID=1121419 RepID=A0A1G7VC45_9FIRM|nr:AraC family transcriptional regulator [Desulfosporosinus hippei]SDG57392.1 AraC family transcriptional regulator [Desulfosporosinus hippei DSM 8344]
MEKRWIEILGQLQPISPSTVDAFVTDSMGVFITKKPMNFNEVEHIHRGYEFIIPFGATTTYKFHKKTVKLEYNKILPVNCEQPHIAVDETSINTLIALFLDVQFLNNIAKSIFNTMELSFENISYAYDAYLQNMLTDFVNELKFKQSGYNLITQSIAIQVGVYLLRHLKSNCLLPVNERSYAEKKPIARAIDYIHANYQTAFSLNDLAMVTNLSPYHFSRVFKAEVGKTPMDYMLDVKIYHAKELFLKCRDKSVTEICFESGFNNLSHFSRTFLKKVGITPTDFIRQSQ